MGAYKDSLISSSSLANHTDISNIKKLRKSSELKSSTDIALGVSIGLFAAITSAITIVIIKKLVISNVHYSISVLYSSYLGLPVSIILSTIIYFEEMINPKIRDELASSKMLTKELAIWEAIWSLISAIGGIAYVVLFNITLEYEDASKALIIVTTITIFSTFLLQYALFHIIPNFFNICGATLILLAIIIVMVYKLADEYFIKKDKKKLDMGNTSIHESCMRKNVFFKF